MIVKAKFKLNEHHIMNHGYGEQNKFVFRPEYDPSLPEDQRFNKATPNGEMWMFVDNPPVIEFWKSQIGKQFYLDFTPAEESAK